jgi:type I restriction enzyme S subunit
MTPVQLLAHFDRISDAPDAVPRLRRFILDLAVRGKLVEQDPNDEPASELLKRIEAEKTRLAREGMARKDKPSTRAPLEDLPFEVPRNWQWSRLAEIGFINPRNCADDNLSASFVPMTLLSAEYGVACAWEVRPWGEIRNGFTHFADGDVAVAKITPCFQNGKSAAFRGLAGGIGAGTTELHVVRPLFVDPNYVLIFLKCPHFIETGIPRMTGTAGQKRVPAEYFACSPFPLPPLAEQRRIVAKVDELMALCDRLEAAQAERESRRDRLVAASLHRLNQPGDPRDFHEHARFHLCHLPRLATRPEHVRQLRQTILSLAVIGMLTREGGQGGTAQGDLEEIAAKKRELQLRKPRPIAPISAEEQWRQLPPGWVWARWDQVTDWITYGFTRPMPHTSDGMPIVTGRNVNFGRIILSTADKTTEDAYAQLNEKDRPKKGDILLTKDGSIGRSAIVVTEEPFCINQSVAVLWLRSCHLDRRFLQLAIDCPQTQEMLLAKTEGVAIKHVSIIDFGKMVFPLAPLAEQRRIVATVDELMALCDRLEAQLATARSKGRRLLEAVLHAALAPTT